MDTILVEVRSGSALPTKKISPGHEKRGGEPQLVPRPSPMKSAPANFLEFFEEESLVNLAGVAGLAQVVLFEGACAAGGVSAPAGDCFQVGASRG